MTSVRTGQHKCPSYVNRYSS